MAYVPVKALELRLGDRRIGAVALDRLAYMGSRGMGARHGVGRRGAVSCAPMSANKLPFWKRLATLPMLAAMLLISLLPVALAVGAGYWILGDGRALDSICNPSSVRAKFRAWQWPDEFWGEQLQVHVAARDQQFTPPSVAILQRRLQADRAMLAAQLVRPPATVDLAVQQGRATADELAFRQELRELDALAFAAHTRQVDRARACALRASSELATSPSLR